MLEELSKNEAKFRYYEIRPLQNIAHLALCFFEFAIESDLSAPIPHEVFPDGCISLLYRRNQRLGVNLLLLKGLSFEPFYTQVFDDDIHWGVKFLPSAAERILQCDPKQIPTQPIFDTQLLPHLTNNLLNKLNQCKDFTDAQNVFSEMLINLKIGESEIDAKVTQAIKQILETKGEMKISEIAKSVNLSPRQLERLFRKSSGITPKQFSRVCRFRATAVNMLENEMNWANRAAEMGFTDQPHLIREFSSLTKRSPKSFEKKIKKIEYHELVK